LDDWPAISVVVPTHNGRRHLTFCLDSLALLDYPKDRLEILLVDNGSTDGTGPWAEQQLPGLRVLRAPTNLGFAQGANLGASGATGKYVAFLNDDARASPDWLQEMVRVGATDPGCVSVASKILDLDSDTLQFDGGVATVFGHAWGTPPDPAAAISPKEGDPLLFACGASMLVDRAVFLEAGGFDRDFFAFFEDVDLGWRLNLFGHRVLWAPKAVVRHKGGETAAKTSLAWRTALHERNALFTLYKNLGKGLLDRVLPASLLLAVGRAHAHASIPLEEFPLGSKTPKGGRWLASPLGLAPLIGIRDFLHDFDGIDQKREAVQARRTVSDEDLLPLFRIPFLAHKLGETYETFAQGVQSALGLEGGAGGPGPKNSATNTLPPPAEWKAGAWPSVTVVIPHLEGKAILKACLDSLHHLDYPSNALSITVVDNGSKDDSPAWIRSTYPGVRVLNLETNAGFCRAVNLAARESTTTLVAFLNDDMRVDPGWLKALVQTLQGDPTIACAGSRILSWDGNRVDFGWGEVNFEGKGWQGGMGSRVDSREGGAGRIRDTFFTSGGAMLIDRGRFLSAGGFDEDYFAYYEDIDLGWRLRLQGGRSVIANDSVTYHRHGTTGNRFPDFQRRFHLDRNATFNLLKNLDDEGLWGCLTVSLFLTVYAALAEFAAADAFPNGPSATEGDPVLVGETATAGLSALLAVGGALPRIMEKRKTVQGARSVTDPALLPLFGRMEEPSRPGAAYRLLQEKLMGAFGSSLLTERQDLLFLSHETIGRNMSGPAMRALEISRTLAKEFRVGVAFPAGDPGAEVEVEGVVPIPFNPENEASLVESTRAFRSLLIGGHLLVRIPGLASQGHRLIIDLYCPFFLENLVFFQEEGFPLADRLAGHQADLDALVGQLEVGDFFLVGSERQRDLVIGMLTAMGRVNPQTLAADPLLENLVAVVPVGIPASPPEADPGGFREAVPGLEEEDFLLFWGGVITDWLDPLTLIRAVSLLTRDRPRIKVLFAGTRHPNADVARHAMVDRAVRLAEELGLKDRVVFFRDWIPYAERERVLTSASLGVVCHFRSLETRFSLRTRLLDCLWAGLPVVMTEGGEMADLVEARGLGSLVPPGDPEALAEAISALHDDSEKRDAARKNLLAIRDRFHWDRAVRPLARFLRAPRHAADRGFEKSSRDRGRERNARDHVREEVGQLMVQEDLDPHLAVAKLLQLKENHIENLEFMIRDRDLLLRAAKRVPFHRGIREWLAREAGPGAGNAPKDRPLSPEETGWRENLAENPEAAERLREAERKELHIRNLDAVLAGLEAKVRPARKIPGFETLWGLLRPFARRWMGKGKRKPAREGGGHGD
jgi:GT2 family glycosyltransferase/glycosyltransferase involved in cell wall biosynthesis